MDRRIDELISRLQRGVVILDGATGTELTRRGATTTLPLWSAAALESHPEVVEEVHRDYVSAGADLVVANTFRTNVRTLRAAGLHARGGELNRVAIELARRATTESDLTVWVAASIAPVEDCYRPDLVPDEATLGDQHREMVAWLVDARADLLWIETMNTTREARAAAAAAHEAGLPFALSFVVGEDGALLSGEAFEPAVAAVEAFEPLAIGLNCIPPDGMSMHLPRLRRATQRPLAAYAHIGNPEPIIGWSFSRDMPPAEYASHAIKWVEQGARIVGGCCGTTPAHIRALREARDAPTRGARRRA